MKHSLYYVTGCKGGVGKSFICNALIFWLLENNRDVRVIDTDDSNPDVRDIYKHHFNVDHLPLSDDAGSWENFVNKIQDLANEVGDSTTLHVVVNGAARDNKAVEMNGDFLNAIIEDEYLNYDLFTLWVLSDSPDSIELLKTYLSAIRVGSVFILRNMFFAFDAKKPDNPRNFRTFTKVLPELKSRIDKILDFPVLHKNIATIIKEEELSLLVAEKRFQDIGTLLNYKHWLVRARSMFSEMNDFLVKKETILDVAENERDEK